VTAVEGIGRVATKPDLVERVVRERAEQRLPPTVEDAAVLSRLVAIVCCKDLHMERVDVPGIDARR
jgi:hypothetical protein